MKLKEAGVLVTRSKQNGERFFLREVFRFEEPLKQTLDIFDVESKQLLLKGPQVAVWELSRKF